ncbi:putative phospholipid-transporting ATPase IM [Exaiptasia diaphana]|nr:putative phospholipid-transporting ATPase IM [Exaiptasia diaphana]
MVFEPDRILQTNDRDHNKQFHFADNFIKTSKYTLLSFLPVNLFEQMQRVANLYFLLQIIIMSIPEITALKPEATIVPLLFVLGATCVKDAYDDIADIVVLSTSEENGLCYIETAELDGETNLKCRQPLPETGEMGDDEKLLQDFKVELSCDPPNNRLDKFKGKVNLGYKELSLDNENVILRGCVLRNTDWVYGVVVYAGQDSKLMMNSGVSKFKRTNLDKLLNKLIIGIAGLLATICILLSVGTTLWEHFIGQYFRDILPWSSFYKNNVVIIGIVHWPSFIMVLNTLIPISLYISVEVIRVGQSVWMNWDVLMYFEKKDTPTRARTTTLTEELGQIEYIFSDKQEAGVCVASFADVINMTDTNNVCKGG